MVAVDFRKIQIGRRLFDFADGVTPGFTIAAQKIICIVNPGQFIVAGLRIKKHQPAIVTANHPVTAGRKKIVDPQAFADMACFDRLSFL